MIELLLVGAAICGIVGALMAPRKGLTPVVGFMVGAPFGIFGLIWIALQDGSRPSGLGCVVPGCIRLAHPIERFDGLPVCLDHARLYSA